MCNLEICKKVTFVNFIIWMLCCEILEVSYRHWLQFLELFCIHSLNMGTIEILQSNCILPLQRTKIYFKKVIHVKTQWSNGTNQKWFRRHMITKWKTKSRITESCAWVHRMKSGYFSISSLDSEFAKSYVPGSIKREETSFIKCTWKAGSDTKRKWALLNL